MIEHIVVAFVFVAILNYLRRLGLKSRGKNGIVNNIVKFALRVSRKLSFLNNKIEKQL